MTRRAYIVSWPEGSTGLYARQVLTADSVADAKARWLAVRLIVEEPTADVLVRPLADNEFFWAGVSQER